MAYIDRACYVDGLAVTMPLGPVGQQIIDSAAKSAASRTDHAARAGDHNRTATENVYPAVVGAVIVPKREGPTPRAARWL